MTLEEKLARFSETLTKETQKQEEKLVEDYRNTLSANFEAHKEEAYANADLKLQHAHRSYQNDKQKLLATTKANMQKLLGKKSYELKRRLQQETTERIEEFKKTSMYPELLLAMAKKVENYCKEETFELYLDASDEALAADLERACGHPVKISDEAMLGGLYAWLPASKIRLNLSFQTKLDDLIQAFHWSEEGL